MNFRTRYLLAYNAVQLCLWSAALLRAIPVLIMAAAAGVSDGGTLLHRVYEAQRPCVHVAQTLAWAEVIHAALRLAGGGVPTAFIQCLGRYVVLVFVVERIGLTHASPITLALFTSWALADVIRYAFYLAALLRYESSVLRWLRYSIFLVLQPVGIAAEWFTYWHTLDVIDRSNLYSVRLPNVWNFAFDFGMWNRCVLIAYFYFGPFMFLHMVRQRRLKLAA